MMSSGLPWSIRGIDEDIRDAARAAARRSGLSVSEWLNDLIAKQAVADGIAQQASCPDPDDFDDDAEADVLADAILGLTRRIRAMDKNSKTALHNLRGRLDTIEQRVESATLQRIQSRRRAESLKGVATIIEDLSREIDNADETARSMVEGLRERREPVANEPDVSPNPVADAIRKLDSRISSMSGKIKAPSEDAASGNLDEIKDSLDTLLARTPEQPSDNSDVLEATLRSLERQLDQAEGRIAKPAGAPHPEMPTGLGDEIERDPAGLASADNAHQPEPRVADDLSSAVAEISARQRSIDDRADIAALAREQRHASESLAALRDDLDALNATLCSDAGLVRIAESIAGFLGSRPDDAALAAVADEVAAIRQAMDAADGPRAIARLEMRVSELARGMEAALNVANAASGRPDKEFVGGLEKRLDAMASRIDGFLGQGGSSNPISALQDRFSDLLDRFDQMHIPLEQQAAALAEIRTEITGLRSEFAEHGDARADHVEAQIAQLAQQLDSVTNTPPEAPALADLEEQVAQLAASLERTLPQSGTLHAVEEKLGRLQDRLSENHQQSIEAARLAACEAVRELSAGSGESDLVQTLKNDLDSVRAAAGEADQRTQGTLESVQKTLARVAERLAGLEGSNELEEVVTEEAVKATGTYGVRGIPAPASYGPATGSPFAPSRMPDDGRPREPGRGSLDLAALRELAMSASDGRREGRNDRRADFIAAARRAAQAAAVEAAENVEAGSDDGKPGAFARIGQAIRNRRRPLLIAAAALVLAISAVQLFGDQKTAVSGNDEKSEAVTPVAAIVPPSDDLALPVVDNREVVAAAPAIASVPVIEQTGLTAPSGSPIQVAFAVPEALSSRFGATTTAPSAVGFQPTSWNKASDIPALDAAIGSPSLREAAALGDPTAAFEIAARYAEGRVVARDFAKAAEWYERAAEAGIAIAQYRLGSLYERGQGVAKNPTAAVAWYRRAAELGNTGAMYNLAVMMSEGVNGASDHAEAVKWFRAAANRGVRDSQYNLGVVFSRGLGQDQDLVESYKWFAIAAASGDKDAATRRNEVGKVLKPDDLAKARAAVKAWRAMPTIAEANAIARPLAERNDVQAGISEADRRSLVRKIQTLLAEQGYDPGPPDGFEGPKTREAVRSFQRNIGVAATGTIGHDLVAALANPSG